MMHVVLFGAGHVGHALVKVLGTLPCVVQWVDARDELFPDEVPANVQIEATDLPDQDRKRDTDEEPRQNGAREEGRKNAEPKHPRRQAQQPNAKRKDCCDRCSVHFEPDWHARCNGN